MGDWERWGRKGISFFILNGIYGLYVPPQSYVSLSHIFHVSDLVQKTSMVQFPFSNLLPTELSNKYNR
jgi:hypothetical protein